MNQQEIDQRFDEILMFIFERDFKTGRKAFSHTIKMAIDQKLDEVIRILEINNAAELIDEIRRLKDN